MMDRKELVDRLRLGGPNAAEVTDEAADTIEFMEMDRIALKHLLDKAMRTSHELRSLIDKYFEDLVKAETRIKELERNRELREYDW